MDDSPRTVIVGARHEEQGRDALALGVALARLLGARLVLVGVYLAPLGSGDGVYETALRGELTRALDRLRATAPSDVETSGRAVGATSVVRGLHAVAEELGADVLVTGTSHLGHATRALRGDVTRQAIHAAPCAVAVAPAGHAARAAGPPARIGVAYDASPEAEQALRAAVGLARRAGGRVHIVSVLDRPYVFTSTPEIDAAGQKHYLHSLAAEARERLDRAGRGVPAGLPVTTELAEGGAVAELVRATDELDLLVMGSRAYGPLRRVLLGSVAGEVVDRAACPVLILPRGSELPSGPDRPAAETR